MVHLRGLCDVLDMTLDDAVKGAAEQAATGVEQALLEAVRKLPDADAEMLLAMAKRMQAEK